MPSDGAHFGKSEPKAIPNPSCNSVFIEPRRQAHWIAESTAKQNLLESQIPTLKLRGHTIQHGGDPRPTTAQAHLSESLQRRLAELFGVHPIIPGQLRAQPAPIKTSGG
jgi:hypothetical protein